MTVRLFFIAIKAMAGIKMILTLIKINHIITSIF